MPTLNTLPSGILKKRLFNRVRLPLLGHKKLHLKPWRLKKTKYYIRFNIIKENREQNGVFARQCFPHLANLYSNIARGIMKLGSKSPIMGKFPSPLNLFYPRYDITLLHNLFWLNLHFSNNFFPVLKRDAKTPVLDMDNAHWKKDFINASVLTDGPVLTAVFYWRLSVRTMQIMTMVWLNNKTFKFVLIRVKKQMEWSIAQTVSAVHILDVLTTSCAYPAMILWKFYFGNNHLLSPHRFINE